MGWSATRPPRSIRRELAGTTASPSPSCSATPTTSCARDVAKARIDVDATVDAALDGDARATLAPRVTFARSALEAFAGRIAERVEREPRDADIAWRDGKLERTRARSGRAVDRAALVARLASVLGSPAAAAPRSTCR